MFELICPSEEDRITCNGRTLETEEILEILNKLLSVAEFYGDPGTYHAIAIMADRPAGWFCDDNSENQEYDYPKPGKFARDALKELVTDKNYEPEFTERD